MRLVLPPSTRVSCATTARAFLEDMTRLALATPVLPPTLSVGLGGCLRANILPWKTLRA